MAGTKDWILVALAAVAMRVGYQAAIVPTFVVRSSGAVLVTGASSGIGEHAAKTLAGLGYTVFAGVRKQQDADRLKTEHPGMQTVIIDVANLASIEKAVSSVTERLDASGESFVALVNNAGVQADMPVELQSSEADRMTFNVNVLGLLDVTRAFIPLLRKAGPGARIVNMGSIAGIVAAPGSATYSASKFAVEGITDSLRIEMQQFGISVSIVQPGYIQSQMGAKAHQNSANDYGVTQEQFTLYRFIFEGFYKKDKLLSSQDRAMPPAESSTPAIVDAITSAKPQTRYPVAWVDDMPAWFITWAKNILPDRVMDLLV